MLDKQKSQLSPLHIDTKNVISVLKGNNLLARKSNLKNFNCEIYYHSNDVTNFLKIHPNTDSPKFIYIARHGNSFDGHTLAEAVINSGNILIGSIETINKLVETNKIKNPEIINSENFISVTKPEQALYLLLENIYKTNSNDFNSIAVTGTNGKTSVTQITSQLFSLLNNKYVLTIGTLGMQLGTEIFPGSHVTTPDYPGFLSLASVAKSKKIDTIVMEMTSHGLKENRLHNWLFNVAAFTNLTQDHLDYHGNMDDYRTAKQKLFNTHLVKNGTAVICTNNNAWKDFAQAAFGLERTIIGVGVIEQKDEFFKFCKQNSKKQLFLSIAPNAISIDGISGEISLWQHKELLTKTNFTTSLLGEFQYENIACAVGICVASGHTLDKITALLPNLKNIPGRLEKVVMEANHAIPAIVVDYAHTPDALEKTLLTCKKILSASKNGKLICVFGCGGNRDSTKRPLMGKIAENIADIIIVTSDNPREEDPDAIINNIFTGIAQPERCLRQTDRRKAIHMAITAADAQDLIVIAGKGHEDYQIIGRTKLPFSDVQIAMEILREVYLS